AESGRNTLEETGHFTSEWVMVSRSKKSLDDVCTPPPNYDQLMRKLPFGRGEKYWESPKRVAQVWIDKGPNLLDDVLRAHPFATRWTAAVDPIAEVAADF